MCHPHRAWAVCGGGAVMLFTVMGLGSNVFSVFQPYIIQVNHFTNAQGSWIITVRSLFITLGMMTAGWVCGKIGLRRTASFSLALVALSCFLFGQAASFPVYCTAGALAGIGYSWGGMIPLSLLIKNWFQDRQAFALALASAGSGLATIVAPAPLTWLIERHGLAAAFWWEGGLILLLALLVFLLVRDRPEQLGLIPYQIGGGPAAHAPEALPPQGLTKTGWGLVLLAVFLIGGPTGVAISHVGVLYSTAGFPSGTVAAIVSCSGLFLIAGKLIYGQLVDHLGGRISNYLLYGVSLLSYLLFCLANVGGSPAAFAAAIFFGLSMPISNVALSVWSRDLRGDAGFAQGLKWSQTVYALGILLLGPVPGMLADATGSYVPAYFLFFLMMLLSALLMCGVYWQTKAGGKPAARE